MSGACGFTPAPGDWRVELAMTLVTAVGAAGQESTSHTCARMYGGAERHWVRARRGAAPTDANEATRRSDCSYRTMTLVSGTTAAMMKTTSMTATTLPTTAIMTMMILVIMVVVMVITLVVMVNMVVMMVLSKDLAEDMIVGATLPSPIVTALHQVTEMGSRGEQWLGCQMGRLSSVGNIEVHEEPILR